MCTKCNHVWEGYVPSKQRYLRCPNCDKFYKGERFIKEILTRNNYNFVEQQKFDKCRYKKRLSFDFYLPNQNICIEYQGKQHYCEIEHFGGKEGFIIRQKRDNIKREYCLKSNIQLIEIPYTYNTEDKIEVYLSNYIKIN